MNNLNVGWNFNNSYLNLDRKFYRKVEPNNAINPELVILNEELAMKMGLNKEALADKDGVDILSGNRFPVGSAGMAQAYAGHQFGYFTMLGDGRAVLLGEHITKLGERLDIQLKGSGHTIYSRGGDGKATLGPMLREYIISESMFRLGIPTTRSLAVVKTGEKIYRGNLEDGAVLTRVAKSHIRVGTFQFAANMCEVEDLEKLAVYTIKRHFPEIEEEKYPYLELYKKVLMLQAELIAKWQSVGFIHGVMNTDNMLISGETIDYGPCAFMDTYNRDTVFSSIDRNGRYAFGNQPQMAQWNLLKFGESLLKLYKDSCQDKAIRIINDEVHSFSKNYEYFWLKEMSKKLGIFEYNSKDAELIKGLLDFMEENKLDYTNTFLDLTFNDFSKNNLYNLDQFKQWYKKWKYRLEKQNKSDEEILRLMKNSNPAIIPRNHIVENILSQATNNNYRPLEEFLDAIENPYEHSLKQNKYKDLSGIDNNYITYCGT
ncbi:MAG: protein adenylyltransferase SelO [Peptoniphilaceae bacterium]